MNKKDKKKIFKEKIIKPIKTFFNNIGKKVKFEQTKFNAYELIVVMIMACVVGIFIGEVIFYNKDGNIKTDQNKLTEIENVYKTLLSDYYGEITEKDLSEAAIKGMTSLLGDKYSFYMESEASADFNERLDGKFTGLGVEIVFIKNDLKKLDAQKQDYTTLKKYYKRKLVDYGAMREIKNSAIGNYGSQEGTCKFTGKNVRLKNAS